MANSKEHLKRWWKPVRQMTFDHKQQESPFWTGTNNVLVRTPFDRILIKAFSMVDRDSMGVFVSGVHNADVFAIQTALRRERKEILKALPLGTEINIGSKHPIQTLSKHTLSDDQKRAWIKKTLNAYVNVLRPRLENWWLELGN